MSSEHQPLTPESLEHKLIGAELEAARSEKLTNLNEANAEQDPADHAARRAEQARNDIEKHTKEPGPAATAESGHQAPPRMHPILSQHLNYAQTLASVQRKLNPAARSFSKVIHLPIVEKSSETLEKSLARPSLLAGAIWTALIVGLIFYLTARFYGYSLSGSELLFSFLVGGALGLILEGLARSLKRR